MSVTRGWENGSVDLIFFAGVFAMTFLSPVRPSAARAAHREQARSYICFGPVSPAPMRATALFVPPDIEPDGKGPRASSSGIICPKQM
ncbi:hypothetical protein [Pseudomonas sp. NPDC008258]|uniref:hypothetical protein n=1 Tax=Pseudomonas sp. NPDC008258 TaxID=3364418 RepID=UPI0036E04A99